MRSKEKNFLHNQSLEVVWICKKAQKPVERAGAGGVRLCMETGKGLIFSILQRKDRKAHVSVAGKPVVVGMT